MNGAPFTVSFRIPVPDVYFDGMTVVMNKSYTKEPYTKEPYTYVFTCDSDGVYVGKVLEFYGCMAQGATLEEAATNLRLAADDWVETQQHLGRSIPPPKELFIALGPTP